MSAIGYAQNLEVSYPIEFSTSILSEKEQQEESKFFTTKKVMKIALGVFGTVAAIGSLLLTVQAVTAGSLALLFPATFTTLLAVAAFYIISRIKDYEDSQCLAEYRKKAQGQPLEETAKEHGWDKMFRYGIPLPRDFPVIYKSDTERKDLNSLINFYEKLRGELVYNHNPKHLFSIPSPKEFSYKFEDEIQGLTPCEVFDRFNMSKLEKYSILNENNKLHTTLLHFKNTFETLKNSYNQKLAEIQEEYEKNIYLPYSQLISVENSLREAEKLRSRYNHLITNQRIEHSLDYITDPNDLVHGARFYGDVFFGGNYVNDVEHHKLLIQARAVYDQQVAPFKKVKEEKSTIVKTWYFSERTELNKQVLAELNS